MTPEATLLWFLVVSGLLVGFAGVASLVMGRNRCSGIVLWSARLWTGVLAVGWAARFRAAGHLPLFGTYESAWSLALAVMTVAVFSDRRRRWRGRFLPATVLPAAGLLAHGGTFDRTVYALTISERSWVVDLHAIVAWATFGVLTVAAVMAIAVLRTAAGDERPAGQHLASALRLGFLLDTAMICTGSIYKFLLFGSPWSFDPVEILALVTWLALAALLHAHLFLGWRGRRLARWTLAFFVLLVVSYRGVAHFPPWSTYHIFDMDRRIHVGTSQLGLQGGPGE